MGNITNIMKKTNYCEFCDIINNNKELLIYEEDGIIVFHDIDKASAVEHILVCPKNHIENIGSLTIEDIPLIQKIHLAGKAILEKLRPNNEYR